MGRASNARSTSGPRMTLDIVKISSVLKIKRYLSLAALIVPKGKYRIIRILANASRSRAGAENV